MAFGSRSRSRRGWFFRTKQPHHYTFLIALILAILGLVSTQLQLGFLSAHSFWLVVAAYVVLALGNLIDGLSDSQGPARTRISPEAADDEPVMSQHAN